MPRYTFGPFLLDPETRVLLLEGDPVPIVGKNLDTLLLLVQNPGRLVDKDQLLSRIWAGSVVEEANLTQSISTVRKVLGDDPKKHRYIATIPGRGYQFVAPVTELKDGTPLEGRRPIEARPLWSRQRVLILLAMATFLTGVTAFVWFAFRPRPGTPAIEFEQRQLTFNSGGSPIESAAISGDGEYLAYSDRAGIHLRLLGTGEERTLPIPGGVSASELSQVDTWFPDGTQLLIDSAHEGGHRIMWVISVMGQSPRELRSDSQAWSVSPDGSLIAFSPNTQRHETWVHEIWVMNSGGDGARRIVRVPTNEWLRSARWSPDGQRLAYIRLRDTEAFIETSDLAGANKTTLLAVSRADYYPSDIFWTSDGWIAYALRGGSDPYGSSLWQLAVDVRSTKSVGKPRRISQWSGSSVLGLSSSADGKRLVLLRGTSRSQTYLGEVTAGGRRMSPPRRLTNDEADNIVTAWAGDSKSLLFMSNRNGKWGVYKQAITGDSASEPIVTGLQDVDLPRLSPDGGWVLYLEGVKSQRANQDRGHRMMRVPVNGGLPQSVFDLQYTCCNYSCAKAPAGICVVMDSPDRRDQVLTAFDPMTGRGKVLRNLGAVDGFAAGLSPDGATYALAKHRELETRIKLLSLTGGSDREIELRRWPYIIALDWSANGNGLYCGFTSPQGGTLVYVELNGVTHELWHSDELGVNGAYLAGIPSPDGRYLAIWGGVNNQNVWMVEGF